MPDLIFQVQGASVLRDAASPTLLFNLGIANRVAKERIQSVLLQCQIRLEAPHRHYGRREQERLKDLFGEPEQWSRSLRSLLWTNTTLTVPPFTDSTTADLPVPCSFDFTVSSTKYFAALEQGEIPLLLLFSGTIFYCAGDGPLQVALISWEQEAAYRLPVRVWREMMEIYYPNTVWLCLRRDVFEGLYDYKTSRGIPTWEEAVASLLHERSGSAIRRSAPETRNGE